MFNRTLSSLKGMFSSQQQDGDTLYHQLDAFGIPVTSVDCRSCSNPCDQGHEEYPSRFDLDTTSQLLGTIKPYGRQVLISTGQSDWDRKITNTSSSFAAHLHCALATNTSTKSKSPSSSPRPDSRTVSTSGIFRASDFSTISILNASHHSISKDENSETVLVFPDYKLVMNVHPTPGGAQEFRDLFLSPATDQTEAPPYDSALKSWVLPYSCVILLCSHKSRDKRCGITAPKLEHGFIHYLGLHGWHVDTDIDPAICYESPLEDSGFAGDDLDRRFNEKLNESSTSERALILFTSHIGGHKFAGNCIIYTPQGSCIWYGRVSPHEVEAIVTNTIIGGVVLPSLLRGGLNLSRPGRKTLYDW